MLGALLDHGGVGNVTLVQCCRSSEDHPMRKEMEILAREKGLRAFAFYSRGSEGQGGDHIKTCSGRLTPEALKSVVCPPKEAEFFFCGPKTFLMDARWAHFYYLGSISTIDMGKYYYSTRSMLSEMGVPKERMHFEYYGPTPFRG